MAATRIDFISSYCDRWCERCAFNDRCPAFACDIAIGMCGDVVAGIELAVGVPARVDGERPETIGERLLADYVEPSADEMADIERSESARRARVEANPLARMSMRFGTQAHGWLEKHRHAVDAGADPVVREAFEIAAWDSYLIGVKLRRALNGRDSGRDSTGLSNRMTLPMPLSEALIERVVAALKADVTATLGTAHAADIIQFVELGRGFIEDDDWFVEWLVDTVQQSFHDTFVDTTWPACPRHPNHPLWFRDNAWWCQDERVAILGRLASR